MASLTSLASGIKPITNTRRGSVYLTELDEDDRPVESRKLQYFPESVSDTKEVNWQTKDVPGASLPLYQYVNSGERTISFTAYFTTDVDHLVQIKNAGLPTEVSGPLGSDFSIGFVAGLELVDKRLAAAGARERNPFIPGALFWLRRFMNPRYGDSGEIGVPLTTPPRKLLLNIPGSQFEWNGGVEGFSQVGGGVLCIMQQCEINYEKFFPSGNPRVATVSLSFSEVPQRAGKVKFPQAAVSADDTDVYQFFYKLAPGNGGGGRGP